MSIQIGDTMPVGSFGVMTDAGPAELSTDDLFAGKKVVLVSVPGAFTPTCSKHHLPGFVGHAADFRDKQVDTIAFTAVNDVFVMDAWGKDRNVGEEIVMLADGNGDYVSSLGLAMDSTAFGMGKRGQRFALIVDDGVVTHVAVEEPGKFELSTAAALLDSL
jgi:peroxiredoxin